MLGEMEVFGAAVLLRNAIGTSGGDLLAVGGAMCTSYGYGKGVGCEVLGGAAGSS